MANLIKGADTLKCQYTIPEPDAPAKSVLSRWSDSDVEPPALIVKPGDEDDVRAAIQLARQNDLQVLSVAGGLGSFVPVTSRTLYLDLSNFKSIQLDASRGVVHIGGGVLAGELLKSLAAENHYTPLPASNSVGVVGCILGGGSAALNGLHGSLVDNAISFRLVTANGDAVEVDASSKGSERDLFDALRGAGHGLGVITSATIAAYKISNLHLTEDKVWTRTLIFKPSSLDPVAQAFAEKQSTAPPLVVTMMFMRSPPTSPVPGAPAIMLAATYFGPAPEAEEATKTLHDSGIVAEALSANTALVPMANLNDRYEPTNTFGGFKNMTSGGVSRTNTTTLKESYQLWLEITDKFPDSKRTALIFNSFDTTKLIEIGKTELGETAHFELRDRGRIGLIMAWCHEQSTREPLSRFVRDVLSTLRALNNEVPRTMPNNMRPDMDLGELFPRHKLDKLRKVKEEWDAGGLFWSPYLSQ